MGTLVTLTDAPAVLALPVPGLGGLHMLTSSSRHFHMCFQGSAFEWESLSDQSLPEW